MARITDKTDPLSKVESPFLITLNKRDATAIIEGSISNLEERTSHSWRSDSNFWFLGV